jgi:hypothetical protein
VFSELTAWEYQCLQAQKSGVSEAENEQFNKPSEVENSDTGKKVGLGVDNTDFFADKPAEKKEP